MKKACCYCRHYYTCDLANTEASGCANFEKDGIEVHCKDCVFWEEYNYGHCGRPVNTLESNFIHNGPMGYCDFGQRKEGEG